MNSYMYSKEGNPMNVSRIPSNELPNALKEENLSDASKIPSEELLYALKEGNLIDLLCILGNDDLDNLT